MSSLQRKALLHHGEKIKAKLLKVAYRGGQIMNDKNNGKEISVGELSELHSESERCVKSLNMLYNQNKQFTEWVKTIIEERSNVKH